MVGFLEVAILADDLLLMNSFTQNELKFFLILMLMNYLQKYIPKVGIKYWN